MNRTVLLIPTLCGKRGGTVVMQALHQAPHVDLETWEKEVTFQQPRAERLHHVVWSYTLGFQMSIDFF